MAAQAASDMGENALVKLCRLSRRGGSSAGTGDPPSLLCRLITSDRPLHVLPTLNCSYSQSAKPPLALSRSGHSVITAGDGSQRQAGRSRRHKWAHAEAGHTCLGEVSRHGAFLLAIEPSVSLLWGPGHDDEHGLSRSD